MLRLTYPVITKRLFPGAGVTLTPWRSCMSKCWCKLKRKHARTQGEASNRTKRMRAQEERNGCFTNHMHLPSMPVRPVWKHEWAACKSIGTRDLVSSKSSADWHVLHVISLHCAARRKIILLWLAGKRLLCCSSCLSEEREHMPLCKRCWLPLLLCQRLDYVQHYPPTPPHTHTPDSPIKDFLSLSLSPSAFKNHRIYDSGFWKSSAPVLMPAKHPGGIRGGLLMCALQCVEQCIVVRAINWGKALVHSAW